MDLTKFRQDLTDQIFTDLSIKLIEESSPEKIDMIVHKIVLAFSSDYFYTLFTWGDNIRKSHFDIGVKNAKVAHDIIMSFYGEKSSNLDIEYLFDLFVCRSFFLLKNDFTILYNIKISEDKISLFVELAHHFNIINDREIIKTIKENIPKDLTILSVDLIRNLINITDIFIIYNNDNKISIDSLIFKPGESSQCILKGLPIPIISDPPLYNLGIRVATDIVLSINATKDYFVYCTGTTISVHCTKTGCRKLTLFGDSITNAISSDNSFICVVHNRITIIKYDIINSHKIKLRGHINNINAIAISPDNCYIVSGAEDYMIKIWDSNTGDCLKTLIKHTGPITSIIIGTHKHSEPTINGNSEHYSIISGSQDKTIKIWDIKTGKCLHTFIAYDNTVDTLAISPDGRTIFASGDDYIIKIWKMQDINGEVQYLRKIISNDRVFHISATSHTNLIVSGGGHEINFWNIDTGTCIHTLKPNNHIYSFSIIPAQDVDANLIDYYYKYMNKQLAT